MTALGLAEDGHVFAMNRGRPIVNDGQSGLLLLPMLVPLRGMTCRKHMLNHWTCM